ncbi:amidase [Paracoccus aminophilus]|uniref:Aspartyl-tRNA(Asn)/glutamyl-tRNA (Gln) amidotransferase subunit A n=1 Tax=Paracoccus aminophilus JCM 7686 TaxID=1367847 RepID=S5Y4J0_PARAH|nr:amidase [Paracoccus aminophilus]AGT10655.1 aspartyl-tRNA(Asn)/glutamyl-tRNA (Gln) amidotransferase subunit A [Paracoccus aminophilus JCM 7686]
MDDLPFLSASEARLLMASRALSAVEYVQALLDRIARYNGQLAAFIEVYADEALTEAARVDARRAAGQALPPLAGIPFAIKDLLDVAGKRTTAQSRASSPLPATADAMVVRQLRAAGAILLGKLTLEEWGIGSPLDDLPWPPARNPWDRQRSPGGSSSGSAVALAAGLVPLALGTDSAGSVRGPAALCGVIGMKAGRGRISRAGAVALSRSLDHIGPMARTARDCRLLYQALVPVSPCPDARPLTGLRIALPDEVLVPDLCSADTAMALQETCRVLVTLGARRVAIRPPDFPSFYDDVLTVLHAEAFRHHRKRLAMTPEAFGRRARQDLLRGQGISGTDYAAALAAGRRLSDALTRMFAGCDILVTPVVNGPAAPIHDEAALRRAGRGVMRAVFNLSGNPVLALCAGFSPEGLPLAAQFVGPMGSEPLLLDVAEAFQAATGWHRRHPTL